MPSITEMPPVSQAEMAAICGVTPQTIRAWERQGCPVERKGGRGVASLYKPAEVVRWRVDQARLAASGDLDAMDVEEAKRRKLAAEAATAEIGLSRLRGDVVEIALVAKVVGGALASCRSRLLQVGSKVAPQVEMAPDAASVKELIDDAIFEALDEISGDAFEFGGGADGGADEDGSGSTPDDDEGAAEAEPERVG